MKYLCILLLMTGCATAQVTITCAVPETLLIQPQLRQPNSIDYSNQEQFAIYLNDELIPHVKQLRAQLNEIAIFSKKCGEIK